MRQDHTHDGAGVAYVTIPGILGVSGAGHRRVYHSHDGGREPHGHEPTDRHGAYGAAITPDGTGHSLGYALGVRRHTSGQHGLRSG